MNEKKSLLQIFDEFKPARILPIVLMPQTSKMFPTFSKAFFGQKAATKLEHFKILQFFITYFIKLLNTHKKMRSRYEKQAKSLKVRIEESYKRNHFLRYKMEKGDLSKHDMNDLEKKTGIFS